MLTHYILLIYIVHGLKLKDFAKRCLYANLQSVFANLQSVFANLQSVFANILSHTDV